MKFAVIDLETDPFQYNRMPGAFAAGFYDGQSLEIYWDDKIPGPAVPWFGRKVCREVVARCKRAECPVYIHNGGKFDLHHLLDFIPRRGLSILPIGSRLVEVKTPELCFRDSYSLIPKPLKSWGKKDINYALLEKEKRQEHKAEIVAYLKEDLRQLYSMLEEFFARFGSNLTLASTAFSVMRKKFGVELPRTSGWHDGKFRLWYFAGRVQFFGLGKFVGDYRILDINSAFPAAMLKRHWFSQECKILTKIPKTNAERCFYEVECFPGGAIPRREENGSVSFPFDFGIYHACGWELLAGIRAGVVRKVRVIRAYRPAKSRDLAAFVKHFYEQKREAKRQGDKATEYFSKIMLNSGYGKFALNPRVFKDVALRDYRSCPCGRSHVDGPACVLGWEIAWEDETRGLTFYQRPTHGQGRLDEKPMRFYNVCTAASITSAVRATLHQAMLKCEKVLYCDTDSVIAKGVERLKTGDGLGDWKKEMRCDVVWIGGKKLYAAHDAAARWFRARPSRRKNKQGQWEFPFQIRGHGWAYKSDFKIACKGIRLPVKDLIAVCMGEARSGKFDAPGYSPFSAPHFTSRTINRADRQLSLKTPCLIPRLRG